MTDTDLASDAASVEDRLAAVQARIEAAARAADLLEELAQVA